MKTDDYKNKCEHYEKILGIGQYDPVKTAFIVLIKMLNQQSEFLNNFKISSHISDIDKDNPKYKRAMEMLDGLPKLITAVNDLRTTLNLKKDDILNIEEGKVLFNQITTPESISNVLGNTAGQQD